MQENITIMDKARHNMATMLLAGVAVVAAACPVIFRENIADAAKNVKNKAQQTATAISALGNPATYGRMFP